MIHISPLDGGQQECDLCCVIGLSGHSFIQSVSPIHYRARAVTYPLFSSPLFFLIRLVGLLACLLKWRASQARSLAAYRFKARDACIIIPLLPPQTLMRESSHKLGMNEWAVDVFGNDSHSFKLFIQFSGGGGFFFFLLS